MNKKTINGESTAWLGSSFGPEALWLNPAKVMQAISVFDNDSTDWSAYGYTRIGVVRFEIDLVDDDAIVISKVASLEAEIRKEQADSQMRVTDLQSKIQTLLAITNEVRS